MPYQRSRGIAAETAYLERSVQEMKSTQPLGGRSFVNYATFSELPHDVSVSMDGVFKDVRLVFTGSDAESVHLVQPSVFYRLDNPEVMESPELAPFATGRGLRMFQEYARAGESSWVITLLDQDWGNHGADFTYYIKAYFSGTTSGTFSFVHL